MTVYAAPVEPPTVALIYAPDGTVYDRAWTWETGQSYANAGYVVKAVAADGHMDVDQAQRLYDYERACFMDCFGRDTPFEEG